MSWCWRRRRCRCGLHRRRTRSRREIYIYIWHRGNKSVAWILTGPWTWNQYWSTSTQPLRLALLMIPARRSAASRHLSSTISRTSRHHALPISFIPIIRTNGTRPIASQNSNWRIYRRRYTLGTASKRILCCPTWILTWILSALQDTTRLPHFDKILIANRYEILLTKNFR